MKKAGRSGLVWAFVPFVLVNTVCVAQTASGATVTSDARIDRLALVTRHNVTLTKADPLTPLSVGNGEFAFTADITGLQTFPEYHEKGTP